MYIRLFLTILLAYLLGSVPFGLIIAKAHGKDLRSIGSGNIGATNVARALGRKWAYLCFLLDVLKGFIPTFLAMNLIRHWHPAGPLPAELLWLWLATGIAAVLGHIYPVYLKFKGGKGVATSFGVALGIWPYYTLAALAALAVWVVVLLAFRYVSLASIVAALAFPAVLLLAVITLPAWQAARPWPLLLVAAVIPLLVIWRHKQNVARLLSGTESKVLLGRAKQPTSE